jgi:hypothetical protein
MGRFSNFRSADLSKLTHYPESFSIENTDTVADTATCARN